MSTPTSGPGVPSSAGPQLVVIESEKPDSIQPADVAAAVIGDLSAVVQEVIQPSPTTTTTTNNNEIEMQPIQPPPRPPSPSPTPLPSPIRNNNTTTTTPNSTTPSPYSSEYMTYLTALQHEWTDCPSVEIVFKDLSYTIHNDATIADAKSAAARRLRQQNTVSGVPSVADENLPNVAKEFYRMAQTPFQIAKTIKQRVTNEPINPEEILTALAPTSGVIRPGTMTLILSPPGGGKSILLRALSGRLNGDSGLHGQIYFNGLTVEECLRRGIHITRLCSYVGQSDVSFPTLTVEETLEFARMNGVGDVKLLRKEKDTPNVELEALDARRSELLMELLGLTECKDTALGSDLVRGVSGGQKKRAQIGESLMSNARLYALDEVSNGLDSAVTLHMFNSLKEASRLCGSSIITALQQVTPETYELFDDIILLREGHVVFHGPRTSIGSWLSEVVGIPFIPDTLEEAGFLIDLLSDPKQAFDTAALAYKLSLKSQNGTNGPTSTLTHPLPSVPKLNLKDMSLEKESNREESRSVSKVIFHIGGDEQDATTTKEVKPSVTSFTPSSTQLDSLMNIDEFAELYQSSSHYARMEKRVKDNFDQRHVIATRTMDVFRWTPYTYSQYGRQFPHSTSFHTLLCCQRQVKLMSRQLTMIIPRLFSATFMSLVYGSLFFQLATNDFGSKLGLIMNGVMFMAFGNFQELPVASEGKQVVVRQIDAGFYPSISYAIAVNLLTAPLIALEAIIFGTNLYWIPGYVAEADRFFVFVLFLFSISNAMSQLFRSITYLARSADVAQQMNMPFVLIFVVFGGFLIPRVEIQDWLIWCYYLSPFSWTTGALALNEFTAGVYSDPDPNQPSRTIGESYLDAFGFRTDKIWQWLALAYLWGFYTALTFLSAWILAFTKPIPTMGTKRNLSNKKKATQALLPPPPTGAVTIDMPNGNGTAKKLSSTDSHPRTSFQSSLPFTPATLAWKDLKYTVYLGKQQTPKVLLNHISGFAEPGKLTALMGQSGAGKTILMDVIVGRKTIGLIESPNNIFVNGRPKDESFQHMIGYCEQFDLHQGRATVKEALEFSAKLRLPASVTDEVRDSFIQEVMDLVGLTNIQNRMVGDVLQPSLSAGQLKLLTIAVELVANPSILFLDEPTTGLDSKSATKVMRAIKRIANTNRTIVCTVHQPSFEIFNSFDKLLLLKRGGELVYFDEIGNKGEKLVKYLSEVSHHLLPYNPLINPANWMLDVVSLDASQIHAEQTHEKVQTSLQSHLSTQPKSARLVVPTLTDVKMKEAFLSTTPKPERLAAQPYLEAKFPIPPPSPIPPAQVQAAFKTKVLTAAKSSANNTGLAVPEDITSKVNEVEPPHFVEAWAKSQQFQEIQKEIDLRCQPMKSITLVSDLTKIEYVSERTRLYAVLERQFVSHWRSPAINVTRCVLMFMIGLLLGLIYYQVRADSFAGLNTLIACIFLGVSLPSNICSVASLLPFFRQRVVYYREKSVEMYGYKIYTASMTIVELPWALLGLICFILPFYFLLGLQMDPALFFQFLLTGYCMVLFFSFLQQIFLASLPNMIAAQSLNGLIMGLLFAFGGLYIKASSIPIGWKWFYYIDPVPKAFIANILTQLHCSSDILLTTSTDRIDGCRALVIPGRPHPVQAYAYVSDLVEGDTHQYWYMIGWILLSCVVLRIISIILFKTVNHIKR